MTIRNIHSRRLPDCQELGRLLDSLAGPEDRVWPARQWPRLRLDGPLAVGARGGHGPIRYQVVDYVPGSQVRFAMTDPTLWRGWHRLELLRLDNQIEIRHELEVQPTWKGRLLWMVALRWLHDALIEDAFDQVEQELGLAPPRPARWSCWVRLLRALWK